MKNNQTQKNISSNWQQVKLGDCLERIEGGGTPSKDKPEYWNGSIPWASVKDVVIHNSNDTQDHISEIGLKNSSSRLIKKGTLIVPTRMALGHAVVFDVDVAINQDLKALYPKKTLINEYLFHWFKSKKNFIERLGSGSTVSGIQQNELKNIKFLLPPLPEQNRIVSVLETWDTAIEKLSEKIELKKEIKKGLMQDLLTGNKRLEGFNEKWKDGILSDIFNIKKGAGLSKEKLDDSGKFECILYGELYTTYNEVIYSIKSRTSADEGTPSKSGDILIPASTTTGAIDLAVATCLDKDGVRLGGDINILRPREKLDSRFFAYYLTHTKKHTLARLAQGVTIVHLYASDFKDIKVEIPKLEEQKKIANIITTAEKEIVTLSNKLKTLKEQKRYLLNNLITGTIRTPETLSAKLTK